MALTELPGQVTVRRILADRVLNGAIILAGAGALDSTVSAVAEVVSPRAVKQLAPHALAVFSRSALAAETVAMDLTLRLASSAQCAGIIVELPPCDIPLATRRLADKLGLPLLALQGSQPGMLLPDLDALIHAPRIAAAEIVAGTLHQLRSNRGDDTRSLVRALSAALDVPVALVDTGGRCIAGEESVSSLLARAGLASELAGPARVVQLDPDAEILLQPVLLSSTGRTHAWLVAVCSADSALGTEAGMLALSVASWAFIAHLANRSLGAERESRQRSALLTDLLQQAEAPSRAILERASVLGWQLSGWHVGVEVDLSSGWTADERFDSTGVIEAAFSRQDLRIDLIDRPSGWVGWFNYEMPPTIADTQKLTHRLRLALLDAERTFGGVRLCAGVGSAGEGLTGLVTSLGDAREASLLARGQEVGGVVEHFDALGLRRLLADWLASDVRRSVARQLLEPLLSTDPSGALIRTLRCFLDEESSPTTTAAILGVHRNTVLDRLERIRKLLPVDLSAPDDRLVVHLATRLVTADGMGIG